MTKKCKMKSLNLKKSILSGRKMINKQRKTSKYSIIIPNKVKIKKKQLRIKRIILNPSNLNKQKLIKKQKKKINKLWHK